MANDIKRQGMLMVLSSPSGAGKSTLSKLLRKKLGLKVSVSATTRAPRGTEQDGNHYYFMSNELFEKKIEDGDFIEWAKVHGNYYGTLKSTVLDSMDQGYDLLFDIDYNGMLQLKKQLPEYLISVFILPPSMNKLRERLAKRSEDSYEVITCRMKNAYNEIMQYKHYDYVLINNTVEDTYKKLEAIYLAEALKQTRSFGFNSFVNNLLKEIIE